MVTYNSEEIVGGRGIGCCPYRDISNELFHYQIRETNDEAGLELVKITTATGEVAQQGPIWLYAGTPRLEELGACFTAAASATIFGCLVGSLTGDKLYVTGSCFGSPDFDSVIIEFDKTTLEVTDSWATGNNGARRAGGHAVMNADGSLFVRCGDMDLDVPTGYIEVLTTTNGNYAYISLASLGLANQTVGPHSAPEAPCCFDDDDNFWFITTPVDTNGTATGKSVLRKATISAVPVITLVAAYELDDDYHALDFTGAGIQEFGDTFGYWALWFNPSSGYLNAISSWHSGAQQDNDEGWYLEIDPDDGSIVRGPLDWSPGADIRTNVSVSRRDMQRRTSRDHLVVFSLTNDWISIFRISTGVETTYDLSNFPEQPVNVDNGTAFHSVGSEIILLLDVDFDNNPSPPPFTLYKDMLFSIIEDAPVGGFIGGSGAQMEPIGIAFELVPFALAQSAMNSCIELGPFRFAEQKQADETAQISSMILGLSQQAIGIVVEEDYMTSTNDDEDWNEEVDQDGDDIYEDWSEGSGDSDDFTLMLRSTDDGINAQFQGDETLDWIEDFGSSKSYVPTGYSAIFHRVHICAHEVDEYWAVKTIDIAGVLTGRHL